jgi:pyruvate formate lyase activating enzyme
LLGAVLLSALIIGGGFARRDAPPDAPPGAPPEGPSPARPISRAEAERAGLAPRKAAWWQALGSGALRCELCPRLCTLWPGQRGYCRARSNFDGELYTLVYGSPVSANSADPIEKKPLFHVLPGTRVTSIATAGCDLGCIFCQNWEISQAYPEETPHGRLTPEQVVAAAREAGSSAVAYTYTEPTIFYEYMLDTAKLARRAGLRNLWITCGSIEEKPLVELAAVLDAANVDLKGFTDEFYRKYCDAERAPVMRTIKRLKALGVHVEITNLVIPGANDDEASVAAMCRWIAAEVGVETPLHFSRYFPRYKMTSPGPTPLEALVRLRAAARQAGLKYVYIGNVAAPEGETTRCAACGRVLIERAYGYTVKLQRVGADGKCPDCGAAVPGIWK